MEEGTGARPFGDGQALMDELAPGLRRLIFRHVRDEHATEDLLQETFLRVLRSYDRYRGQASVKTWAWTIARNLCLDHLRSHARSRLRLLDSLEPVEREPAPEAGPESLCSDPGRRLDLDERRRRVDGALAALSPEARNYLILRVYSGLSYREIARRCGVPATGVGARISRALKSLKRRLG